MQLIWALFTCQSYQCGALRVLLVDFLSLSQQLLNVSKHVPLC